MATPEEIEKLKKAYEEAKKRYKKSLDTTVKASLAFKKIEAAHISAWKKYLKAKENYEAVLGTKIVDEYGF